MTDAQLHNAVLAGLNDAADLCHQHKLPGIAFVETAGGPASPAPSGSLQVRPCLLVTLHCPFAPQMLVSAVRRVLALDVVMNGMPTSNLLGLKLLLWI